MVTTKQSISKEIFTVKPLPVVQHTNFIILQQNFLIIEIITIKNFKLSKANKYQLWPMSQ